MPSDPPPQDPTHVTAKLNLTIFGQPVQAELTVPAGPTGGDVLVPIARELAEYLTGRMVAAVEHDGKSISCRKGCGACCRQVVPIALTEARAIHKLVQDMPEPRRSEVRARFAAATRRFAEAGLLDILATRDRPVPLTADELGLRYFQLRVACPFLEDESCSIHPDRPIACRQYLVTSPAERCADPQPGTIDGVPVPIPVDHALMSADPEARDLVQKWLPLTLALDWVETHPEPAHQSTGPAIVEKFFEVLTERKLPPPVGGSLATTSMLNRAVGEGRRQPASNGSQ